MFNSDYLVYGIADYAELIELKTGRVINQFFNVTEALWVGKDTLLIQTIEANKQISLLQVDALTGTSTMLATGDAATGLLLSPNNSCSMSVWTAC